MRDRYLELFEQRAFRLFWLGFTVSALGDAMSSVALTWFVYQATHSAQAVGLFLFVYTAPVLLGGFLVGPLLDRHDRRTVLLLDSLVRSAVFGTIPVLHATGHLTLWLVYAAAAVYGLLKMIPLAGGPALIPTLVPTTHLDTANALESLA